jgi:hypothetical protein
MTVCWIQRMMAAQMEMTMMAALYRVALIHD